MTEQLDWSKVQAFLAVAETGSLSGAAQQLGLTQPTIGRQIKTLEAQTNSRLFDRHPRGLNLTEAGTALVPAARSMRDAAAALGLALATQTQDPKGTVRITASLFVAHYILPPILAETRAKLPEVAIELVANDQLDNLLFREADIAIRMVRPTQDSMITSHLGDLPIGFYAANSYLAQHPAPHHHDQLSEHDLVGYDRSRLIIDGFALQGFHLTKDAFSTRCDNQSAYWQLVRAGCGIGLCQTFVGDTDPLVTRVLPDLPIPDLPLWLTTHPDLHKTPTVNAVWQSLRQGLARVVRTA